MRAMWIGTELARELGLGNDFFDHEEGSITPPGSYFIENAENLYGLWFVALQYYPRAMADEAKCAEIGLGEAKGNPPLRTFQARAAQGAMTVTNDWIVVHLVTIIEAYLKGILEYHVVNDREVLMANSEEVNVGTGILLGAAENNQIADTLARHWVKAWLKRRKNPKAWINWFTEIGVSGFSNDLKSELEEMLGVRHLLVHSAGHVDEEYLRRHEGSQYSLGDKLSVSEIKVREYISTTFKFFAPIEAHFIKLYAQ